MSDFVEGQRVKVVEDTAGTDYAGCTGTVSRHDSMGVLVSLDALLGTVNFQSHELALIEPKSINGVVLEGVVDKYGDLYGEDGTCFKVGKQRAGKRLKVTLEEVSP